MPQRHTEYDARGGFTLIELSIVLVVIGLIIGAILVGRDLIEAAQVRSQISQIQKYNAAVNTFRIKFNCLPGDCANAADFGFIARGAYRGQGDGNGQIEGVQSNPPVFFGPFVFGGETEMFWVDLSTAGLIDAGLNNNQILAPPPAVSASAVGGYFPAAKIGQGNYVYVWSGGWSFHDSFNYFGIANIFGENSGILGNMLGSTGLTVQQAFAIDTKMDDGLPQSGLVIAIIANSNASANGGAGIAWATANISDRQPYSVASDFGLFDATTDGPVTNILNEGGGDTNSTTTCYDYPNPSSPSNPPGLIYSVAKNANQVNCALSFRFQ